MKLALSMITLTGILLSADAEPGMQTLYDFDAPDRTGTWRTINDDVMGGISQSKARVLEKRERLEFSGELSLKNNGGFASVRSSGKTHELTSFDGLALRLRGDGRPYYLSVHTDQIPQGGSYRVLFPTRADRWITVWVPFESLGAVFHGRPIPDAPEVNLAKVRSVGLLLADKKEGPFKLELDWIKAYSGGDIEKVTVKPEEAGTPEQAERSGI